MDGTQKPEMKNLAGKKWIKWSLYILSIFEGGLTAEIESCGCWLVILGSKIQSCNWDEYYRLENFHSLDMQLHFIQCSMLHRRGQSSYTQELLLIRFGLSTSNTESPRNHRTLSKSCCQNNLVIIYYWLWWITTEVIFIETTWYCFGFIYQKKWSFFIKNVSLGFDVFIVTQTTD